MATYPVSLLIKNKLCIVIGAGDVAVRKIKPLLASGAKVKVIAPEGLAIEGIETVNREYNQGDLEGAFLVIAATDDQKTNEQIYKEAVDKNILVNVVDNPSLCTFYVPSVVKRGKLQITISTDGVYPALSKKLRKQLETEFGTEYENYLQILEEARKAVIDNYPEDQRKAKLNEILNDKDIMELAIEGKVSEAMERLNKWIST